MSRTTRFVPPAPTKYAFPAIVLFSYLTAHSQSDLFASIRAQLPPNMPSTIASILRVIGYVHVAESAAMFLRAKLLKGLSLADSVKWALATYIYGFGTIRLQLAQHP